MGFAESFIQGFTRGRGIKEENERAKLAREKFDEDKKRAEQDIKLRMDEHTLNAALGKAGLASRLLEVRRQQFRPTIPAGDGVGPPAPDPAADTPIELDLSAAGLGKHSIVPTYADDVAEAGLRGKLAEMAAVRALPPPTRPIGAAAAKTFGVAAGTPVTDDDIAALTLGLQERGDTERARIQAASRENVAGMRRVQSPVERAQAAADVKNVNELPEKLLRGEELLNTLRTAKEAHAKLSAAGPIAGRLTPDLSKAAQTLNNARRIILTRSNPLKGQGQVSNFERQLAEGTVPDSSMDYSVASSIYDRLINEAILAVQEDQRLFGESKGRVDQANAGATPGSGLSPEEEAAEYLRSLGGGR